MTITAELMSRFASYPVFTYRDVSAYFSKRKIKRINLIRLLSYLKASGKIYRISKGAYTTKKEDYLAGFAFQPFYYGLLYAMTLRELWTQNARPEIVTLKRVRRSSVPIFEDQSDIVRLHHARPRHFFGFEMMEYVGTKIPVSDNEKILIDLFYYKIRLPVQSYGALLASINTKKLKMYLAQYDRHTKTAVIGFVKKYKKKAEEGALESPY